MQHQEEQPKIKIRKRSNLHSSIFSSMITVLEDSNDDEEDMTVAVSQVALSDNSKSRSSNNKFGGGNGGGALDDSFRSSNSLVNRMQSVLNEESWWSSSSSGGRQQRGEVPATLLLNTAESAATNSSNSGGGKRRGRRVDCIFGILLLTIGFVIGGVFIHRDKLLFEMNSLLGTTTSKSRGGVRSLPVVLPHQQYQYQYEQEGYIGEMSYEERQRMYREKREMGLLKNGGVTKEMRGEYVGEHFMEGRN